MSVPVWSVNGLNAGDGGVGNLLQPNSSVSASSFGDAQVDHSDANFDAGINFDLPDGADGAGDDGGARDSEERSEEVGESDPDPDSSAGLPPPPLADEPRAAASGKEKARRPSLSSVASASSSGAEGTSWSAAIAAGLKPLNVGGSGTEKYRPPSKRKVSNAEGLVNVFAQFAESVACQAALDRKVAADVAKEAKEEARAAREEARAEREHQMAMAAQCKQQ
jgi:hypothetical protein